MGVDETSIQENVTNDSKFNSIYSSEANFKHRCNLQRSNENMARECSW